MLGVLSILFKVDSAHCDIYFQGHIQTIYPGESALFEDIVDYEDLSEDAPHCVTKSFPTNIDHCILWAVRKVNSWKKEKPTLNQDLRGEYFS